MATETYFKTANSHSDGSGGYKNCACAKGYASAIGILDSPTPQLRFVASWPTNALPETLQAGFGGEKYENATLCGRVEVNYPVSSSQCNGDSFPPGEWGYILDLAITMRSNAELDGYNMDIACNFMGLSGGPPLIITDFNNFNSVTRATGPAWLLFYGGAGRAGSNSENIKGGLSPTDDPTGCAGNESSLLECLYKYSNTSFCGSSDDPSVSHSITSANVFQLCCEGNLAAVSHRLWAEPASCTMCAAGTFKPTNGTSYCKDCTAGKFSATSGATMCSNCTYGTYSGAGESVCTLCPGNTSTAVVGSSDVTDCSCNAGYTGPDGGACTACAVGTYKSTNGSALCQDCQAAKYSDAAGATS